MSGFDLSTIEDDVNLAESVASSGLGFLAFIPGLAPYAGAISLALPQIIKATKAIESTLGHPVGSIANAQAIADGINPESEATLPTTTNPGGAK